MKVLNLYAGIGGNRKLWTDVDVTAVEKDFDIAAIYMKQFDNDVNYTMDAKEYLIKHYNEYDFIWASPPCPTHSRARYWGYKNTDPVLPDFSLYEIIVFLKHHYTGKWCVENVMPYYTPLIQPTTKIGRHYFWSNFMIHDLNHVSSDVKKLSGTSKKDKLTRNQTDPEIGLHILKCAYQNQLDMFN
jgi:DNA (cytosine-5)-methyltransferase 1